MNTIFTTIIALSAIGVISAVLLYIIAQKFRIVEDPRIDEIENVLPKANCGGCGYPGCRNFAEACIKSDNFEIMFCPVGGTSCMSQVAKILGKESAIKEPMVAVIRCNGSRQNRAQKNIYDSAETCRLVHNLFRGESGCQYGCLRLGDCVQSCKFNAMYMDKETGLPVVIEDRCVYCGACVKSCPRKIIELRKKGPRGMRVFVSCINKEKGSVARLNCTAACIACGQCFKICPHNAITIENNLAYISFEKCKLCRKCFSVCPTKAIQEVHFPAKAQKEPLSEIKSS
ncbi:MAG: RnfABCDGE type electron transport complex subunit B [Candidatus Omnitrophica bacterium]|nr:RnfABCDGE type electron transport complex subunit B [Candidatus Omnitrophota bacterium]